MLGPGAASAAEFEQSWVASLSASAWLSLLIATGIGLHNFSEGLAIGQAGATGEISLAIVLIIGFGLHNATEGFGIVAPLSGEPVRPSWRFLLLLGLIGGGPTFVGTLIGQAWVSEALSILFLALAAGSILFVVLELAAVNRRMASKHFIAWFVLLGLLLGFATEFVVEPAVSPSRGLRLHPPRSRLGGVRLRLRLSARLRPRGRAPVHVRGAGRRGEGRRRRGAVRRARRRAASSSGWRTRRRTG